MAGRWAAALFLMGLVPLGGVACGGTRADGPSDDGGPDDAGAGGGSSGEAAEFDYAAVEGAVCGNGSPHGVGVSAGSDESSLVLFFNGGGACWDALSCFVLRTAVDIEVDYDEALFRQELAALQASGLLDRADGATPFSAANFVVVPYCTGDLFVGEAVRDYSVGVSTRTVHHVGGSNVRAVLADLAERFPATQQIWLTGVSAGGYGALFGYELVAAAFPEARVDVLVDGSPLIEPTGALLGTWRSQWQARQPDCAGCDTSLAAVAASLHAAHPDRRFALLTSQNDEVIRSYFGYGLTDITPQIDALAADEYDQAQAHAFVVPGTEHVLLGGYRTRSGPNGSLLRDFVDGWAHGDERFVTVRP